METNPPFLQLTPDEAISELAVSSQLLQNVKGLPTLNSKFVALYISGSEMFNTNLSSLLEDLGLRGVNAAGFGTTLEKNGYITRKNATHDRRVVLMNGTQKLVDLGEEFADALSSRNPQTSIIRDVPSYLALLTPAVFESQKGGVNNTDLSWSKYDVSGEFAECRNYRLPLGGLHTLATLSTMENSSMSGLAKLTGVSTAAITGSIDRFEKKGLAERIYGAEDRRKIIIKVAMRGNDYLTALGTFGARSLYKHQQQEASRLD